ncbi:MAG: hypothetical protein WCB99_01225 [Candidatus Cybelea sp.]|jgi:hypothetical protein
MTWKLNAGILSSIVAVIALSISARADNGLSRVYVTAYPCAPTQGIVVVPGAPEVHLYDQAFYGDRNPPPETTPPITVTKQTQLATEFYFDVKPGNYDAFVSFRTQRQGSRMAMCDRNGPLDVLMGKNRHLFVATMTGITDWHLPGVVAGTLPLKGVDVAVLVYPQSMQCGDDVSWYGPETKMTAITPREYDAVVDDGAYYANIHAYGRQDRTVALRFSGALFTGGTVLLTVTPDTNLHKPPFIEKDITAEILRAATANPFRQQLVCIDGF